MTESIPNDPALADAATPPMREFAASTRRAIEGGIAAILIGACALLGLVPLAIALAVVVVFLIPGWPELFGATNLKIPGWILAIVAVASLAAGVWGSPMWTAMVGGFSIALVFFGEMARGDDRSHLVEQISGTFMGVLTIVSASFWLHTVRLEDGWRVVVVTMASLLVCLIINTFGTSISQHLAALNAVIVGVGVALVVGLPMPAGLALGVAVGTMLVILRRGVYTSDAINEPFPGVAAGMLPHSALGALGYLAGLAVL